MLHAGRHAGPHDAFRCFSLIAFRLLLTQFIRFTGAGFIATLAHYLVLVVLVEALDIYAVIASFFGGLTGLIVGYLLNYRFTFNSSQEHRYTFSRFLLIALAGLGLNVLIVKAAIEQLGLHYFVGQILATGVVLLWNFWGSRFWAFRNAQ